MRIGITEIILIIVVVLAFVRPEKLKEYSKSLGEILRDVKAKKEEVQAEIIEPIKDDINVIKEPLDELAGPVKEVADIVQETRI